MVTASGAAVVAVGGAAAADPLPAAEGAIRFATFNAALTEDRPGGLLERLSGGGDAAARDVAEVIQRVRPDILVLQELDRDAAGRSLALFRDEYLARPQGGAAPIAYPHALFPESNTGEPSGVDLDGDGVAGGPSDAKGFGRHPGQYAFAVLSRLPLGGAATFRNLLWRDVPDGLMPLSHYSEAAQAVLPLSSKTHLAVTVETARGPILLLAAHPTPPVFDDPDIDWNGRRNADEIRLLVDLLPGELPAYVVPDEGALGARPAHAVVLGDLNADPTRGDARPGAIARLIDDPRIQDVVPTSANGDITADFNGGMRVDYVLPTAGLEVTGSGVFWPATGDPLARLNATSDHHLVFVDVRLP
nr:endonuclease/exonuclease/phosphatase family protein [Acuticoccus mangrovi]